jgi:hypothetical protein
VSDFSVEIFNLKRNNWKNMCLLGVLQSQQKFKLKCELKNDKQMGVAQRGGRSNSHPIARELFEVFWFFVH